MPKATIEYNLPEEQDGFETAVKAVDLKLAITEFDSILRNIAKYGDDGYPELAKHPELIDKVREILHKELEAREVRIYN